jgi:hypothetical protein
VKPFLVVFLSFFLGLADLIGVGIKRDHQLTPVYETVSSASVCGAGSIHLPYVTA